MLGEGKERLNRGKPFVTALNDRLVTGQVFPGPYRTAESVGKLKQTRPTQLYTAFPPYLI